MFGGFINLIALLVTYATWGTRHVTQVAEEQGLVLEFVALFYLTQVVVVLSLVGAPLWRYQGARTDLSCQLTNSFERGGGSE